MDCVLVNQCSGSDSCGMCRLARVGCRACCVPPRFTPCVFFTVEVGGALGEGTTRNPTSDTEEGDSDTGFGSRWGVRSEKRKGKPLTHVQTPHTQTYNTLKGTCQELGEVGLRPGVADSVCNMTGLEGGVAGGKPQAVPTTSRHHIRTLTNPREDVYPRGQACKHAHTHTHTIEEVLQRRKNAGTHSRVRRRCRKGRMWSLCHHGQCGRHATTVLLW